MEHKLIEDKTFEKGNFTKNQLLEGDYELCKFINCDFSETSLSLINFVECEFVICNLSLARFDETALRDVKFKECKLLGLHFENCAEFGLSFSFENCTLDHSSFYKRKIHKTNFKDCTTPRNRFYGM